MAASFDPKSFSRNEWGILGGVLVAFIGLFFHAYHVSIKGFGGGGTLLGWHFVGLWFPTLILGGLAVAIVVIRALRADLIPAGLPIGTRVAVGLLLIIAVIISAIRGLTYPSVNGAFGTTHVSAGASFGTWIVCLALAVAAGFAILDFVESEETLPTLPAKPGTTTTPADPS
jgi:hypothetical protein